QPESALEDFRWSSRAGSRQKCRSNSTLRRPTRMQELRLRPVDPAFEQASREAAADAGGPLHRPSIQPEEPAREIGSTERSEESGRMKTEPMELSRRDDADAARNLVADGDGRNEIVPGNRDDFRQRERRRNRRAAHVHDRLV